MKPGTVAPTPELWRRLHSGLAKRGREGCERAEVARLHRRHHLDGFVLVAFGPLVAHAPEGRASLSSVVMSAKRMPLVGKSLMS